MAKPSTQMVAFPFSNDYQFDTEQGTTCKEVYIRSNQMEEKQENIPSSNTHKRKSLSALGCIYLLALHIIGSLFCLSAAGDTTSSTRLFDAIVSGCILATICDELELPFEGILDYKKDLFQQELVRALSCHYRIVSYGRTIGLASRTEIHSGAEDWIFNSHVVDRLCQVALLYEV
ncbi:hypothetical protein JHK82_043245 [Glycine max]|nr:hypothetical protein JHK86_043283 [Glycine max]KAG4957539.1 hypothetical protein JHK85_043919 [Glycine max]KAG5106275.1 hypothetical protein JHK82_043245 [Glycine max]KAG5117352.1 hypothetical protein JHK84_043465 [Glycine max]